MAPECAKLDLQEMMLPGLSSLPLLVALAIRYESTFRKKYLIFK
jgi:hypothetical protein